MEILRVPSGALNLAMAPCFWNILEGETPPLPPFATALERSTKWTSYFCCKTPMDILAQFEKNEKWSICWCHNLKKKAI